ncbi:hypothetical protein [Streptomyces sp. NPDC048111]|uniref:hypothetical protein n=1 Tax=Streptomyces sp. NPDC048111 TaxID=3365500 RepID=UPI003722C197
MLTSVAEGHSRLSLWLRVREFAVPPSMIETATARRSVGDWAGACAAAGFDVDLDLRSLTRTHGRDLAAQLRADLRQLAPDLLRWHMPRIAPDGLLRPGLTLTLARYGAAGRPGPGPVHLVVRTPPAWADAGQRIALTLWGEDQHDSPWGCPAGHPHPRPQQRFRLDLHRHLWDARRTGELALRSGADGCAAGGGPGLNPSAFGPRAPGSGVFVPGAPGPDALDPVALDPDVRAALPPGQRCAVGRWAAEAGILLGSEGRSHGDFTVRLAARRRLQLALVGAPHGPALRLAETSPQGSGTGPVPVLPDAATWVLPDLDLIGAGAIEAGRLHPLVAAALAPGHEPPGADWNRNRADGTRVVECRGERHRIALVDGVLAPLDHPPAQVRQEELLLALGGPPLPCLRAIDEAHRRPECLTGVRERLDHGDIAGALAVVEQLLGPEAVLRDGALKEELEVAARRRLDHGLYRTGLMGPGPGRIEPRRPRPRTSRAHPRHTHAR